MSGGKGGGAIAATSGGGAEPVLCAHGLGRSYDGYIALGSFTFEVQAGEFVALIGPNGAGKTTFLNLAAGLLDPTSGGVEVAGQTPGSLAARQALSFLPDTPVFYEDLSVVEHLEYVAALHGVTDASPRIDELIERLGLDGWEDALGAELSKGMRQKVSIALALVRPFKVLLADEPLDGLDPPSREVLFAMLAETQAAGAAIVVSTHRPDVIAAAGRCVAIRDGRLAYDGAPDPAILNEIFDRSELEGA
ncbi:MAG TPA: ABC transporter ATP-binding protein [Solirubrobacterales bacterium]|nr:ABC transporter ATP-binding protein [Solirubrobacterales bacterium]